MMARRMRRKSHVRCRAGEKVEIISNPYLLLYFPNAVYESYVEVMYEYVNNLKEWIGSFQNRKTVTGREMIERMIKRLNM